MTQTTDDDPDWDTRYDLDGDAIITVVDIMKVVAHWDETREEWQPFTLAGARPRRCGRGGGAVGDSI